MNEPPNLGSPDHVALLAHELQSPLTALRVKLSQALGQSGNQLSDRQALGECLAEVRRLERIVADVLLLSRAAAGHLGGEIERFDLVKPLSAVISTFESRAIQNRIELVLELPSEELPVRADERQMTRVLSNLLDNSLKFTPAGGRVIVHARKERALASVRIADSGIGIPAEALPRLFDPFFQVGRKEGGNRTGAGLGLSIVRALAERNRAEIQVESQEGRGSTFSLTLPLDKGT